MTQSRINKLREAFNRNPERMRSEAVPYIRRQAEHLSHLKPDSPLARLVKSATLKAVTLLKRAEGDLFNRREY